MKWLKTIFKKKKVDIPPMPPCDEIVESLYDKELNYSDSLKICRVIYSNDKSKRFIILESNKGFLSLLMRKYVFLTSLIGLLTSPT